jgi:hypothetical protein
MSAIDSIARKHKQFQEAHTQHISKFILTTALLTNVCRHTKVHDDVCLLRELLRVQAADEQEANTIDKALGQNLQLATQGLEREGVLRDRFEGEAEICARAYQHLPMQKRGDGDTFTKSDAGMDILAQRTLKAATGLLELLDITFSENQNVALLIVVILEVRTSPSRWRDDCLREASGQGVASG